MDAIAQAVAFLLRDRKVPGLNPVGNTFLFYFFLFYNSVHCALNKVYINHKREKLIIIKDTKLHICMTVVYPLPRIVEIICKLTLTHLISNATIIHICSRSYLFKKKIIVMKNCYLNIKFLYN